MRIEPQAKVAIKLDKSESFSDDYKGMIALATMYCTVKSQ